MLMAVMHVFSVLMVVLLAQVLVVIIVLQDIIKMVIYVLNANSHA